MRTRPHLVDLADPDAADAALTGAKAANLALARRAGLPVLPGMVLTTAWDSWGWSHPSRLHDGDGASSHPAATAWRRMSDGGRRSVVVRSSSTTEDGDGSSLAGVFTSVLDVGDWPSFVRAVDEVLASAQRGSTVGAPMAVLVQRQLTPARGGVLFTADPVGGRRDRLLVSACDGGPDRLVSGIESGRTAVLSRRGRVVDAEASAPAPRADLRRLARLAARAEAAFGGPQDIEWAVNGDATLWLLQSRPITTPTGRPTGPVLGAGPLAETFPEPLSPLEADLWLAPLREGLEQALLLTGAASTQELRRSPVARQVDGWAVADLEALGTVPRRHRILRKIDPRPGARRLRAAWRVGRLARALPAIARDVITQVDGDLLDVPPLDELGNAALLAVLDNGRTALRALHGYEALAGMLVPTGTAGVTAASIALSALAEARAEAVDIDDLTRRDPVVLALTPPRIGPGAGISTFDLRGRTAGPGGAASPGTNSAQGPRIGAPAARAEPPRPDSQLGPACSNDMAVVREALRLRARWVQELTARAAWLLGCRLVAVGVMPSPSGCGSGNHVEAGVRLLTLDELRATATHRTVPDELAARTDPAEAPRPLPARFRLTTEGRPLAELPALRASDQNRAGAGGGVGIGPAHVGHVGDDPPAGAVLIVTHLDPRLAATIPQLAGLVAETGSPLSHLAILAREHGVPTVVGVSGATTRYRPGQRLEVDGTAGTVSVVEEPAGAAPTFAPGGSDHPVTPEPAGDVEIGAPR
ncbi:MAG TPA: PEP/pyruvate-binding domain-containing protein [Acidimicrobiales bacterium]|nr:PEP/pyruvate-binding domain-containing protein [Acidimicrobiales bacterium]